MAMAPLQHKYMISKSLSSEARRVAVSICSEEFMTRRDQTGVSAG
jgi:hypothetical protein